MRLILAIQAFFALLFTGSLPAKLLPPPQEPAEPPEPQEPDDKKAEREKLEQEVTNLEGKLEASEKELAEVKAKLEEAERGDASAALELQLKAAEEAAEGAHASAEAAEEKLKVARAAQEEAEGKLKAARDAGALALLAWLQREGRLIDFLMEDVDDYEDEQIGAAVRAIHKGCRKVLDEGLRLAAILPGEDEAPVEVPKGFDPVSIQLTGNVKGEPPFKGTLMHHGWRTDKVAVPVPETVDPHVLAAAEVEL